MGNPGVWSRETADCEAAVGYDEWMLWDIGAMQTDVIVSTGVEDVIE